MMIQFTQRISNIIQPTMTDTGSFGIELKYCPIVNLCSYCLNELLKLGRNNVCICFLLTPFFFKAGMFQHKVMNHDAWYESLQL